MKDHFSGAMVQNDLILYSHHDEMILPSGVNRERTVPPPPRLSTPTMVAPPGECLDIASVPWRLLREQRQQIGVTAGRVAGRRTVWTKVRQQVHRIQIILRQHLKTHRRPLITPTNNKKAQLTLSNPRDAEACKNC